MEASVGRKDPVLRVFHYHFSVFGDIILCVYITIWPIWWGCFMSLVIQLPISLELFMRLQYLGYFFATPFVPVQKCSKACSMDISLAWELGELFSFPSKKVVGLLTQKQITRKILLTASHQSRFVFWPQIVWWQCNNKNKKLNFRSLNRKLYFLVVKKSITSISIRSKKKWKLPIEIPLENNENVKCDYHIP